MDLKPVCNSNFDSPETFYNHHIPQKQTGCDDNLFVVAFTPLNDVISIICNIA